MACQHVNPKEELRFRERITDKFVNELFGVLNLILQQKTPAEQERYARTFIVEVRAFTEAIGAAMAAEEEARKAAAKHG